MPQALIGLITPYIASGLFALTGSTAFVVAATGAIASAVVYGALAAAAYLVSAALAPAKPEAPKPEDGKYNLKQSVPPLVYVLGRVKKGSDYALLEEKGGIAYHVLVWAAHSIQGYQTHYLHDEAVTLYSSGNVNTPTHFEQEVLIKTRLGEAASTAYSEVVSAFPSIWTVDHRGDGLATVMMKVWSVAAEDIQKVFPSGMPQHQAVGQGHNGLIDPRTGLAGYSTNLAVFRYWHLTHPVGGKMSVDDLYTPDWANAAAVCDQTVTNRSGGVEDRYHGGLWFRADNNPVQVGRLMDQAAELVIYERADGKVGVHAGEYVEPDVRLSANDLISVGFDPNKRRSTNVLAVRGRFTDPNKGFNTVDAAIYGQPYPSDDERTKAVENQAVQSHNHMARLQKLAYIRANAPRVKIVAHYEPARNVPYRRFITVHYPPKLTEAVVEITGRPTLSLRNLTYEFEGIVVPANLYAFVAASEEGAPGANVLPIEREDVPVPDVATITVETEDVLGGSEAAFIETTFNFQNAAFTYEMEWSVSPGGSVQTVKSQAGALKLRTSYLADALEYLVRVRTWSFGASSDWIEFPILVATPTPHADSTLITADSTFFRADTV